MLKGDAKARRKLMKLRRKAAKAKRGNVEDSDSDSDSDSDDSSDDDEDMKDKGQVMQSFDSKQRQTIRNLRIREDRAKYLYNLNSSEEMFYDPKTRAMRGKDVDGITPKEHFQNFVLASGDVQDGFKRLEALAQKPSRWATIRTTCRNCLTPPVPSWPTS